ncbi:radical SAM protein [Candidatus Woesearchaeota archaeon]|nr:radical SAM protein [Candidatus Woesearchaeota archaeon]
MTTTIIDCYTDEPAGLGVPPYLGTYPRYIYGRLKHDSRSEEIFYLTIDDIRLYRRYSSRIPETKPNSKTNINILNLTRNWSRTKEILSGTDRLIVILGVHVPGKYLSAVPGTLKEVLGYIEGLRCYKILTGPAATEHGTQLEGGKFAKMPDKGAFDETIADLVTDYDDIAKAAVKGAEIQKQISDLRIAEIETGRGCTRYPGCSFCTEPLKHRLEFREQRDIHQEIKALIKNRIRHFRLGKQSCFYSYKSDGANCNTKEIEKLLKPISEMKPDVLHIDNANPMMVDEPATRLIVKYCTAGNTAAFGVESFDPDVQEKNNLNCNNEGIYKAVRIINKHGAARGENGMPKLLPGINLLFGLIGENKGSFEHNISWLKRFVDESLLLRRINIRQVTPFEGTRLYSEAGSRFLKKNRKHYWKWRDSIRRSVDYPMLKLVTPAGIVLKQARAEVYDGKNTFCRQVGTYPLIIGVKQRLKLGSSYDLRITGHMLRSITGEPA